jgi:E3 SUMO-protein ligase RanBP2
MVDIVASSSSPSSFSTPPKKEESKPTTATAVQKPFAELFKKAEGAWDCEACYVNNGPEHIKCLACSAMKPGANPVEPGANPSEFETIPKFSFGFASNPSSIGFSDLATSTTAFSKPVDFKGFGTGGSLFTNFSPNPASASTPTKQERRPSEGEENTEEFVPTAEFTPVIPLPPLVEVKLGDENENVIFKQRAKIYRFDSSVKEWKERGLGEIKILQDKDNPTSVRVVMWREKIGKLACNHRVTGNMKIEFYMENKKVVKWSAIDHADEEPRPEIFTCRFGQEDKVK